MSGAGEQAAGWPARRMTGRFGRRAAGIGRRAGEPLWMRFCALIGKLSVGPLFCWCASPPPPRPPKQAMLACLQEDKTWTQANEAFFRSCVDVSSQVWAAADLSEECLSKKVAQACQSGLEFKLCVSRISATNSDGTPEECRELGVELMRHKKTLQSMRSSFSDAAGAGHELLGTIADQFGTLLEVANKDLTDFYASTRRTCLHDAAKARANLERVAGGLADGSSWKASLKGTETLADKELQLALQQLGELYERAMKQRFTTLKTAPLVDLLPLPPPPQHYSG